MLLRRVVLPRGSGSPRSSHGPLAPILVMLCSLLPVPASAAPLIDDGGWSQVSPSGPGARGSHAAAYDPVTESMIIFGGTEALSDTWRYVQTPSPGWTQLLTSTHPTGRKGASMVYDGTRRRMLLFGGYDVTLNYKNDVWALSLDGVPDWGPVATAGTPPPARLDQVMVLDTKHDRLIVMGGIGYSTLNDVWVLSLSGTPLWTQLVPASGPSPDPRYGHTGIYDPVGDRLIVWGGSTGDTRVWAFDLASQIWSVLATTGTAADHPIFAESIYDPELQRMMVFGGFNGTVTSDTYELTLAGAPAWRLTTPVGTPPTGRAISTAVYQPSARRMLVYGGVSAGGVNVGPEVATLTFASVGDAPVLTSFAPMGGDIGTVVHLYGVHLGGGGLAVDFNGVAAVPTLVSDGEVTAPVPDGATTGYIHLTTTAGSTQSPGPFIVAPAPVLVSVEPDSGHIGDPVQIHGLHLTGALSVAVGVGAAATFTVVSDSLIQTAVDSSWTTGPVAVTTPTATTTSTFTFHMLSPEPRPRLAGVKDVANDQGGRIMVRWYRSERDGVIGADVVKYRVWRRAPTALASRLAPASRPMLPAALAIDFWEPIGEVPAVKLAGYALTVPTLQDSLPGSNPYTAVFVQAVTPDPNEFLASGIDSAYSVDNLPPAQPAPFVAVYAPDQVALHWGPNHEGDLAGYQLHRGNSAGFVPGAGNRIATLSDTGYVDHPGAQEGAFYKLAAVDIHGNVGRYATVSPSGPTSALAALVSASETDGAVRLVWASIADPDLQATLYRSQANGPWQTIATLMPGSDGLMRYQDRDVAAGGHYDYRLGAWNVDHEVYFGQASVDVPALSLAIAALRPNPSAGSVVALAYSTAGAGTVRLDVLDVAGRRVLGRDLAAPAAGRWTLSLDEAARWPAGVYTVRLRQGAQTVGARLVVSR